MKNLNRRAAARLAALFAAVELPRRTSSPVKGARRIRLPFRGLLSKGKIPFQSEEAKIFYRGV